MGYDTIDQAISLHNDVPQGCNRHLHSDVREAEQLSPRGSDCGIATSTSEPAAPKSAAAFGARRTQEAAANRVRRWKAYMRRATTHKLFQDLPLAQGIRFGA